MCLYKLRGSHTARSAFALVDPIDGFLFGMAGIVRIVARMSNESLRAEYSAELRGHGVDDAS